MCFFYSPTPRKPHPAMALPFPTHYAAVATLLLLWLSTAHCSDPLEMAQCGPQLLLLAPCAPFVQGLMPAPVKSCCDDLVDLYSQQPQCLCLVLNDTSSFPINQTLALHLPHLCGLNTDNTSACPGLTDPSATSDPQTLDGATTNSSIAEVPVAPLNRNITLMNRSDTRITQVWVLTTAVSSVILQFLW